MSGVTLSHRETDVRPECTVVFGAGRLGDDGLTDSRRIEIDFESCYFARTGPHPDWEDIEAIGYAVEPTFDAGQENYLDWRVRRWLETGSCPDSGFYVARESSWLRELPAPFRIDVRHYVVDGRDGYVELIARRFAWREWLWTDSTRDAASQGPIVGEGAGID